MPAALAKPRASNPFATVEWTADRLPTTDRKCSRASDSARVFTAEEFVEHLRCRGARVIDRRRYWQVQCPAHDDRDPSLTVRPGEVQPVIFKCHAGCSQDAVLAAAGLSWANVLRRTGSESLVVRGLEPCDHDHAADGFEGISFEAVTLETARLLARRPEVRVSLDDEGPQVERDHIEQCKEQYVERCEGMFVVSFPHGARHLMKAVLTDFVNVLNERRSRGEVRAVPYGSRSAANRLAVDERRNPEAVARQVRKAMSSLVKAGVLTACAPLGRTPTYALAVQVRCLADA